LVGARPGSASADPALRARRESARADSGRAEPWRARSLKAFASRPLCRRSPPRGAACALQPDVRRAAGGSRPARGSGPQRASKTARSRPPRRRTVLSSRESRSSGSRSSPRSPPRDSRRVCRSRFRWGSRRSRLSRSGHYRRSAGQKADARAAAKRTPSGISRGLALMTQRQHDGLRLGERVEHVAPSDSPDAGARPRTPAEREVALPVVRGLVDVHPTRVDRLGEAEPPREVTRPHRRQEAVRRRVRSASASSSLAVLDYPGLGGA